MRIKEGKGMEKGVLFNGLNQKVLTLYLLNDMSCCLWIVEFSSYRCYRFTNCCDGEKDVGLCGGKCLKDILCFLVVGINLTAQGDQCISISDNKTNLTHPTNIYLNSGSSPLGR